MPRLKALLAPLLVAFFLGAPLRATLNVAAADVDDPDMTDSASDSVSGRSARDLVSGWVANESASTIELNLHTTSLEPYTPYSDWQNLPVVYYEFFFDVVTPVGPANYVAKATVPMHGPLAAFSTFELYNVTYATGGTVTDETVVQAINGRYTVNSAVISFTVDKSFIGNPTRDDTLEGIWGRVQSASQRNSGDAITEDVMMSHLAPGRSFTFSGGVTYYSVRLANVTSLSANASNDDPAHFQVNIHSDSESVANVTLRNASSLPPNWTMSTDKAIYAVEPGQDVLATITVTPGGNGSNITRRITLSGQYRDDTNTTRSTENTLTLSIYVPSSTTNPGGKKGSVRAAAFLNDGLVQASIALGIGGAAIVLGYYYFEIQPNQRQLRAKASYSRIAQMKLGKAPRSGMPMGSMPRPGLPPARGTRRPGSIPMPPPPRPGSPMPPRPGTPRQAPGPMPRRR